MRRLAAIAVGVLAAATLAACSGSAQPSPSGSPSPAAGALKTYSSQPYRLSVQYDQDSLSANDATVSPGMLTLAFSPSDGRHGGMLLLACKTPRPVSAAALRQWLVGAVHSYAPDSRPGRLEHVTVGGLSALVSEGTAGHTLRTMTYVLRSGRYAYLLSLQGSLRDWQDLLPRYQQVVRSFTVLP